MSYIFKRLNSTATFSDSYNFLYFRIINKGYCKFELKVKEALRINCRKRNLNAQKSPPLFLSVFCCCCCCCFSFLFYVLILLSLTLIVGIFYWFIYTLLLPHLITTQFVTHFSLSSIIFIVSTPNIGIFHCLNYTFVLLYLFITHLVIDFLITMQLTYYD